MQIKRKRGRPPNVAERRRAAELRAKGLSLRQVGERLGISRQAVAVLLRRSGVGAGAPRKLHLCKMCGNPVAPAGSPASYCWAGAQPTCLACVGQEPASSFGRRLRAARQAAGMSGRQLAARVGVCANTVFGWETGHQRPRPAKIHLVAAALSAALDHYLATPPPRPAPLRTKAS